MAAEGAAVEMLLLKVAILSLLHPQQVTVNDVSITRQGEQIAIAGRLQAKFSARGKLQIRIAPDFRRTYTGELEITAKNNELQLILTATEEALIAAIVGAESPPSAPAAALEAQAIVTRSWLRASRNRHGQYDLCDTTHCQHFKEPTANGVLAAAKTKDLILVWQGKPFPPAYSASCGGRTKSAAAIGWRDSDTYPYFPVDCAICQHNEQEWTRRFDGYDAATLREHPHSEATRIALGRRLGWDALPGNNYELSESSEGLLLNGRGQGHGLGYCQMGGAGLAQKGRSPAEILRHYFPGTNIISRQ
ncbi:MAG: hypothetical protein IT162_17270 [Bryobacterales bacterium]|nr:hypothetical protein [Bryobacterales bacterium]